ncbi:MAG: XRE family transcriptional regulator [Spirulina sp. DLM2.Bin59]|nr:MAG: XRE family transcriptional regulator [Spirulina sp. DLM2.Bin59]
MKKVLNVYISGALTDLKNPSKIKKFYENIGNLCESLDFKSYVPHLNTDPIENSDLKPKDIYEIDKSSVIASDLVIAYLGIPSLGVGMELAYADIANIPIILLYEKHKTVSRFARGIPNTIAEIIFEQEEDAFFELKRFLLNWTQQ